MTKHMTVYIISLLRLVLLIFYDFLFTFCALHCVCSSLKIYHDQMLCHTAQPYSAISHIIYFCNSLYADEPKQKLRLTVFFN